MAAIHVLLEGPDDERFFRSVLRPELGKTYDKIRTYLYAKRTKKEVEEYVKTLRGAKQDYVVLADFDARSTCYGGRKLSLRKRIRRADPDKIAIANTEIESWYLAGMGRHECESLQIPYHPNTEPISKEEFEQMRSRAGPMPRAEFMSEILGMFDTGLARRQNASFGYVWDRFVSKTPRSSRVPVGDRRSAKGGGPRGLGT